MHQPIHSIRAEDIHSLTDFLRNHRSHVEHLERTGRPSVLTVNGSARLVVQDAAAYQRVIDLAEQMETILAVREGIDSIEHGEGMSLDEFKRRFREKFPLPDAPGATGTGGS